jgi:C_GCAxxG_C_C family probable redox protein
LIAKWNYIPTERRKAMKKEFDKEELLNRIEETARNYESDYHGCSRSALKALQDYLDLGDDSVFLASTPLAGGIAMMGDTCGALLGGLLAVGLATASPDIKDEAALYNSMGAGYKFFRRFIKKMGSSRCRDIQTARLGYYVDLTDPEKYERAKKDGLYNVAGNVVGEAARLAAEFILEMREKERTGHK